MSETETSGMETESAAIHTAGPRAKTSIATAEPQWALDEQAEEKRAERSARKDVRLIDQMARGLDPTTHEEVILSYQLALTNRAGMAALAQSHGQRNLGAPMDHAAVDSAVKLLNLALKQLEALNHQRTLRAWSVRGPRESHLKAERAKMRAARAARRA